ncbi:MAG: squalene synthase HpnC [Pirellula sp.]
MQTTDPSHRAGQHAVILDLARFGPDTIFSPVPLAQARIYCKSLAKKHYENFSVASLMVPRLIRQDFYNIYAFCRWSDDLADELDSPQDSAQLLTWWHGELHRCFRGEAEHPVFVALNDTRIRHQLRVEPFDDLIDAFVQDQTVFRYETNRELLDYCARSANPVGRILLRTGKVEPEQAIEFSDKICTGLQIANFCQDIRRDASIGRIYLPRERWGGCDLDENQILSGTASPGLIRALRDWVQYARGLILGGLPLAQYCPRWLARDVQLFARGGLTILRNIEMAGFDVWSRPIRVSKSQKLGLLLRAIIQPRSINYRPHSKLYESASE